MSAFAARLPEPTVARQAGGIVLLSGIVLAALTEAIAGTALTLGRSDLIGDTHATPDEFAWLDISYTFMKFIGFLLAPWVVGRVSPRNAAISATLVMGGACGISGLTADLDLLVVLRCLQGFAGGVLLVAGQAALFLAQPAARQPLLQAVFAMGSVVAPATLAPALQGWMIDTQSWEWMFLAVAPLSMAAASVLLLVDDRHMSRVPRRTFDATGLMLVSIGLFCITYVLSQGNRWDWFESKRIIVMTAVGMASLLAFVWHQRHRSRTGLVDVTVFGSEDFCFAFAVSFVAGAALFGSAYLIPSFAVAVLGFTPTEAGLLLLPSGAVFVATLLLAAYLMQARQVPPVATVPFGILAIMVAMWMLSGSTSQSGSDDMMLSLLLRGFGLGLLFLSITLIAFNGLAPRTLTTGIGLFNTGRQLGGLMGVAGLQTFIEHGIATNASLLNAHLMPGSPVLVERLAQTSTALISRGMDAAPASRLAFALLQRSLTGQSTVIAFDSAFTAIALLFVAAAPFLVTFKIVLHAKHGKSIELPS